MRLTAEQLASGEWLAREMMARFNVPSSRVLAHREVSPGRKFDPLPAILDMNDWRTRLAAPASA